VEEALAILTNYDAKLSQMIKDQPVLQKQRDESLKRLIEPDLTRAKSAIDKEVSDADAREQLERKDSKWLTPYKYNLKLLQDLQRNAFTEKTKLQKVNISQITKICDHLHQATIHFYGEKIVEGELALAEAIKAAPANPEYGPIIQIYMNGFKQKRMEYAAKQQAAVTNAVIGAPAVNPAAPGVGAPGVDSAVARALAVAGGQAQPAPMPQPVNAAPQGVVGQPQQVPVGTMPVQQPINPGMTPPPVGGVPQAGVPMPQAAYAQPVAPAPAAVPAPVEEESTIRMDTILMVAGGAVVLVLLLVILLGKKKPKGE
jgi:hypothetical protein